MKQFLLSSFQHMKWDVRSGLRENKVIFLVCVLLYIFIGFGILRLYRTYETLVDDPGTAGFVDLWIYAFGGFPQIYIGQQFIVPLNWLGAQMMIAWIIGDHINRDMENEGLQYLIRSHKKSEWLLGKVGYCVVMVLLFYGIAFCALFVFSCLFLTPGFSINHGLCSFIVSIFPEWETQASLWIGLVLLPILTSIVISVGQMVLSLFVKPVYAFFTVLVYMIMSAYTTTYWVLGCYSMLARKFTQVRMLGNETLSCIEQPYAILIEIGLLIIFWIIGNVRLREFDFLQER